MLCLCFLGANVVQRQHGHLCQDLCTCQILTVSKFTSCSLVDRRSLHLFQPKTYHRKVFEKIFPMMPTSRLLLAVVFGWGLYECSNTVTFVLPIFVCILYL
jgi:hypothetical protein